MRKWLFETRSDPACNCGFSLMELLVVITVIALLAGLSMGAISVVRESARATACMNNQRQLGIIFFSYAENKDGALPPAYVNQSFSWLSGTATNRSGPHGTNGGWEFWGNYLAIDYLPQQGNSFGTALPTFKVTTCPSGRIRLNQLKYREHTMVSYGVNTALLGANTCPGGTFAGMVTGPNWPGFGLGINGLADNWRLVAQIPHQSTVIMLAEHEGIADDGTIPGGLGGAKSVRSWTDPPSVRSPLDANGIEMTLPAGWSPGLTGPMGKGLAFSARHRSRSNVLFHDGHCESLTPWQTCEGGSLTARNLWTGTW